MMDRVKYVLIDFAVIYMFMSSVAFHVIVIANVAKLLITH